MPNSDRTTLQPLSLREQPAQEQVVAQPAGATNDILSPVSSVASKDSGYSTGCVSVRAQSGNKKSTKPMQGGMVPQQNVVPRPSSTVTSKTDQTLANQHIKNKFKQEFGWVDPQSGEKVACDEKGELTTKQQGCRQVIEHHTVINGVPVPNSDRPTLQPLSLREQPAQEQVVAQPAGATNDILSPVSSVASKDSGYSTSSNQ